MHRRRIRTGIVLGAGALSASLAALLCVRSQRTEDVNQVDGERTCLDENVHAKRAFAPPRVFLQPGIDKKILYAVENTTDTSYSIPDWSPPPRRKEQQGRINVIKQLSAQYDAKVERLKMRSFR